MSAAVASQSVNESKSPTSAAEVVDAVRAAYEASQPLYLQGGGTALNYGSAPSQPGQALDLSGIAKIVDYTPRDMTIVVEAGVTMADLVSTLAAEGQHLPIDVPRAAEATIGGVVATNWSGPRRLGHGTIRDYVIGINAVDGRGTPFKGGGRVVKNVAGYDFCKLLVGSLGTLGVITQLALKVKPRPERTATIVSDFSNLQTTDEALTRLANLEATPVAIDLLVGGAWSQNSTNSSSQPAANFQIAVVVEGTESETGWLSEQIKSALSVSGGTKARVLTQSESQTLFARQTEFSDRGAGDNDDESPMVLKVSVPPSAVTGMVAKLLAADPSCKIQAHAGNGIIFARFTKFRPDDLTKLLVGQLRPAAVNLGGSLIVVRSKLEGLTSHLVWGGRTDATVLLAQVKEQFDPRNILNPGRFAYH